MKRIEAFIAVIVLQFTLTGTASGQAANQWQSGEEIYQKSCQYCHGTGVGVVITGRQLVPQYIKYNVRNGMRAMPAFRQSELSDEDLDKIANYIAGSK